MTARFFCKASEGFIVHLLVWKGAGGILAQRPSGPAAYRELCQSPYTNEALLRRPSEVEGPDNVGGSGPPPPTLSS
jgi:hypothetical protein